jgi:hypothetical protein
MKPRFYSAGLRSAEISLEGGLDYYLGANLPWFSFAGWSSIRNWLRKLELKW